MIEVAIRDHWRPSDYRLLNARQSAEELSISVSLLWKLVKNGELPRPIYITLRSPRWRYSELHAAMDNRRLPKLNTGRPV